MSEEYTQPAKAADDFSEIARRLKEIQSEKEKPTPTEIPQNYDGC